ncbi:hypothetical protein AX15_006579 [Amanita polypyramis BW_CC]|nr:hypothetical protein AX15_006579 [Amanita polypyramis BW_CC]
MLKLWKRHYNDPTILNLASLPAELILHIGYKLLQDPETTLKDIRELRLVCKSINRVFAPVALSKIHVFCEDLFYRDHSPYSLSANSEQLCCLVNGSGYVSYARTLVLHPWDPMSRKYKTYTYYKRAAKRMLREFAAHMRHPRDVCRFSEFVVRLKARNHIKRINEISFDLPNVRCVRWSIWTGTHHNSERSLRINLRLLETLPSLTELDISLFNTTCHFNADLLTAAVANIRSLQKLTVYIGYKLIHFDEDKPCSKCFTWIKHLIAHNPDLTYLNLHCSGETRTPACDLFEDVPVDRPLKLRHLRICHDCFPITPKALLYLRSLTSLDLAFPLTSAIDEIWQILMDEKIYVSSLRVNAVTYNTFRYLDVLDNLTRFAIHLSIPPYVERERAMFLFLALAAHADTLEYLSLDPYDWGLWHNDLDTQLSILRLTRLKELTLVARIDRYHEPAQIVQELNEMMHIVSRTEAPLTIVIEGQLAVFKDTVRRCREDDSREVQLLSQRIVHSEPKDILYP